MMNAGEEWETLIKLYVGVIVPAPQHSTMQVAHVNLKVTCSSQLVEFKFKVRVTHV